MGTVPEQVRRAAEQANAFYQANDPEDKPETNQDEAPQNHEPEVTNQDPPAALEQPPAQPADPAQEPPAPESATPPAKTEDYEQKYRTLQGLFNAERRDRQAEKQGFEDHIRALETKATTSEPQPEPTKSKLVTDKDIETYGPELVDLIGRKASEMADQIVEQRLAALKPELDKTREQVTSVAGKVYQNDQERFYGELARAVPDWQEVNVNERWLSWLGETDPVFGVPRQVALDNASSRMDHARVALMFSAFKQTAGMAPSADTTEPVPPTKPALSPTPRTVGHATPPSPREPDTSVSRTEIGSHYRRSASDATYRTSKEHAAMEGRIATAMATGKIIEA